MDRHRLQLIHQRFFGFFGHHHKGPTLSQLMGADLDPIGGCPTLVKPTSTGWWLGHPSEKYEFVNWDD